jgi:pimeloyl-ACP methyl ester carboxylesterase
VALLLSRHGAARPLACRRPASGGARLRFQEGLASHHTVVAPDYPPVRTVNEFMIAFDGILRTESIDTFALGDQSNGGLLAQTYLTHSTTDVDRLILSSTGPANYGRAWLPAEKVSIVLARILPERIIKGLLAGGLLRAITLPEADRAEWVEAIRAIVRNDLSRADVVSHFAVASNLIRTGVVTPAAFRTSTGRILVLSAETDPTQNKKDAPRYESLFGRGIGVISLGRLGHAAALVDPNRLRRCAGTGPCLMRI